MLDRYRVVVRVQFPSWNERDGIVFYVEADSKSEAVKAARRENALGGQVDSCQHGLSWWTATIEAR